MFNHLSCINFNLQCLLSVQSNNICSASSSPKHKGNLPVSTFRLPATWLMPQSSCWQIRVARNVVFIRSEGSAGYSVRRPGISTRGQLQDQSCTITTLPRTTWCWRVVVPLYRCWTPTAVGPPVPCSQGKKLDLGEGNRNPQPPYSPSTSVLGP